MELVEQIKAKVDELEKLIRQLDEDSTAEITIDKDINMIDVTVWGERGEDGSWTDTKRRKVAEFSKIDGIWKNDNSEEWNDSYKERGVYLDETVPEQAS